MHDEVTPATPATEETYNVYLTGIDDRKPIASIKALRETQQTLTGESSLSAAKFMYDTFLSEGRPVLIGDSDNLQDVQRAIHTLQVGNCSGAVTPATPGLPELEDWEDEEPDEGDFEESAYQTALVLLAACGGSPTAARTMAETLGKTTQDEDYFAGVVRCYEATFPVMDNALLKLLGGV